MDNQNPLCSECKYEPCFLNDRLGDGSKSGFCYKIECDIFLDKSNPTPRCLFNDYGFEPKEK